MCPLSQARERGRGERATLKKDVDMALKSSRLPTLFLPYGIMASIEPATTAHTNR